MKFNRVVVLAVLAVLMLLAIVPANAQDDAPPVLILPVDQAQFLPGAMFDFRVEVHVEALPENFAVTVNGTPAAEFFGSEGTAESWTFGSEESPTPASSLIWRNLTAPAPGDYVVEVTAGGTTTSVTWTVREPVAGEARNIILFVGDGMSVPMISAIRAARGMVQGRPTNPLAMDGMEVRGFVSTSSVDSLMADSANTASSLNTGHIGSVNATGTYSDTSPDALDDPRTETLASLLRRTRGYAIGSITTADLSDATPAAVWAHGRNRNNTTRNTYLVQALESGYVDVLMGGGARRMIPQTVEGSRREDDRDLFAEYEAAGYTIVDSATTLNEVMAGELPERLLGVFHPNDMNVWLDRNVYTENVGDFTDQPGLVDMTVAALNILNQNENGFYLQIEAASVDKQMHALDQERALSDLIEMDDAVAAAIAWAQENAPDTLIVVTADHAHGYEVYGTVNVEEFNAATDDAGRVAAIGIYNGAGYPDYPDANGDGFPEWGDASVVFAALVNNHGPYTEDFQVSPVPRVPTIADDAGTLLDNPEDDPNGITLPGNVPSNTGVHTLMDNPVYASGPGAELFNISAHQSEIFFRMANAIGLDPSAEGGMASMAAPAEAVAASPATPAGFGSSLMTAVVMLIAGVALGFGLSRARRAS